MDVGRTLPRGGELRTARGPGRGEGDDLLRNARTIWTALLLAAALGPAAPGCGSNHGTAPQTPFTLSLRNGTWTLNSVFTRAGSDSCLAVAPETVAVADTILCDYSLVGNSPVVFNCTIHQEGDSVSFDCTGQLLNAPPCVLSVELRGRGATTDTTLALGVDTWVTLAGPDDPCGIDYRSFAPDCTTHAEVTGHWLSAAGADTCTVNGKPVERIGVDRFLEAWAGGNLRRR